MVLFNYSTRELTAKVVYYGPGICGKTTNLQFIHDNLPGDVRGKMLSLATKTDRTLFFDFLPIDLGDIRGMKTRVQLYTVPGQVFYNETRKLVLKGVDGIVFVADSQETMIGANIESFKNLEENLKAHGMKLAEMPHVIQFNKRDLPRLSSIEDMNSALNKFNAPFYESVATTGIGVQDTLKAIVKLVLLNLTRKYEPKTVAEPASAMASVGAVSTAKAPRAPAPTEPPFEAPPIVAVRHGSGRQGDGVPVVPPPPTLAMPAFDEDEIDGLVNEVEELPSAAATHEAEDTTWIGEPDHVEARAFEREFTGPAPSVPAEDLLSPSLAVPPAGEFEIDRGFDPEWVRPAALSSDEETAVAPDDSVPIAPFPIPPDGASDDDTEPQVLLTEVASDDDLFSDPSLEIAHLTDGQAQEIIVPVMLGEGESARRFKLAIRLRLDAVD